jgi:beta-lactamase class A
MQKKPKTSMNFNQTSNTLRHCVSREPGRYFRQGAVFFMIILLSSPFNSLAQIAELQSQIEQITLSKKLDMGFATMSIEDSDSLAIHGNVHYPMQSVYKFPLALAVLDQIDKRILSLDQEIFIKKSDLLLNTWSPLKEKYPEGNINMKLREILGYTVSKSDNNACDILFRLIGGTGKANNFIHNSGFADISIAATEQEMHADWQIQYKNWTTPWTAVRMLKKFYLQKIVSENSTQFLWETMLETSTGIDRLKGQLPRGTKVAHKTGSSGKDENAITAAFNDIGIIELPNGKHYAIAVFITNSKEEDQTNAGLIAEISKKIWDYYTSR